MAQVVDIYNYNYHLHPWDDVFDKLRTNPDTGLNSDNYRDNLRYFGNNSIHLHKGAPWWKRLFKQFKNMFAILLMSGGILCFIAYSLNIESPDNLYLGIVLFVVVIATALFSFWQETKSSNIMEGFKNMIPSMATVYRDGQLITVDANNLVMGDLVEIGSGDKVPADIRLLSENNLKVDNSMLTGENEPQDRLINDLNETILEAKNMIFYGTLVVEGNGKGIVVQTGNLTEMGKIASLATSTKTEETPIRRELSRFVKIITVIAMVLGIVFVVLGLIKANDYGTMATWRDNIISGIGIIVANVPEGLLVTVTIVLTLAAKRMAKKCVLVKNLESIETLGSTSNICSDKTGTLTYNRMTVSHFWLDNKVYDVQLDGDNGVTLGDNDDLIERASFERLYFAAKRCNTAVFEMNSEEQSVLKMPTIGNMSDSAILKCITLLEQNNYIKPEWRTIHSSNLTLVGEIPFNSRNKWHFIANQIDKEFIYLLKGAPEMILDRCSSYLSGGSNHPMNDEFRERFQQVYGSLASRGERVLGFAIKYQTRHEGETFDHNLSDIDTETSSLLTGYAFIGFIGFMDPPRAGVRDSIEQCQTAGIRVVMVTGDHPLTAKSIAKEVNIIQEGSPVVILDHNTISTFRGDQHGDDIHQTAVVVHGKVVNQLTDAQWDNIMSRSQLVFARTSPEQKLIIVNQCQSRGHIVAVTGDGVNDSPALKAADIGIAMGIAGSDVSKEAADMILLDDNFSSIVNGIIEGRTVFDNLKKSIAYTLSSNIPEIMPFLIFMIVGIPLPLTTVLILCIDLGTDMIPAISLAYEQPEDDIMLRKPRDPKKDRLVTWQLISFSYLQIGMLQAAAGFFAYFCVMYDLGFPYQILPGLGTHWGKENLYCRLNSEVNITALGNNSVVDTRGNPNFVDLVMGDRQFGDLVSCHFDSKNGTLPLWATSDYCAKSLQIAQTAFFVTIIIVQIADLLICKTRKLSLFSQPFNKVSLLGFASELALGAAICYAPFLNIPLKTQPITWYYWLFGIPFAIIIIVYDEIRKLIIRKFPGGIVDRLMYW